MSQMPGNQELEALLEAGRRAVVDPSEDARQRLAARLAVLPPVGVSHPSSASTTPAALGAAKGATALKAALLFMAGTATGLVAKDHVWPPSPPRVEVRYVDRVVPAPAPSWATVRAPAPVIPPLPSAPEPAQVAPAPRASAPASTPDQALAAERTMIETARSALLRGEAPRALEVLERHAKEFPHGQLAETREALAVQALARSGRMDEAKARAARFHRSYPSSVYLQVVDQAVMSNYP